MGATKIASYVGLPRSSVQRKLKMLLRIGLVERIGDDGPYRIRERTLHPSRAQLERLVAKALRAADILLEPNRCPKWAPRRFPSPWFKGNRGGLRQYPCGHTRREVPGSVGSGCVFRMRMRSKGEPGRIPPGRALSCVVSFRVWWGPIRDDGSQIGARISRWPAARQHARFRAPEVWEWA